MKVLVLSGGRHPYQESTPVLETFLRAAGHEVTMTEDGIPEFVDHHCSEFVLYKRATESGSSPLV